MNTGENFKVSELLIFVFLSETVNLVEVARRAGDISSLEMQVKVMLLHP